MPCPGPFHFSHSVDYIYEFCPLPNPDVGPSIFVCDVKHTSFHFGLCGRKFVLCLFGQCPGLCTICHSWQHTGVVHLSLQADGKVAFEYIPVFGVCRPACHDSSLYLFVLVLFLEAVVLSQVHQARNQRGFGGFGRIPLFVNPPPKKYEPPPTSNVTTASLTSYSKYVQLQRIYSDSAYMTNS